MVFFRRPAIKINIGPLIVYHWASVFVQSFINLTILTLATNFYCRTSIFYHWFLLFSSSFLFCLSFSLQKLHRCLLALVKLMRSNKLYCWLPIVWVYWNMRFLGLLSSENFLLLLTGRRCLLSRRLCFELLVKFIPDFLIKSVNFPQKNHHLSIKLHDSAIKRLHLLFHQINTKVYFLNVFPICCFASFFMVKRIQLPYNFLCKLIIFMVLL